MTNTGSVLSRDESGIFLRVICQLFRKISHNIRNIRTGIYAFRNIADDIFQKSAQHDIDPLGIDVVVIAQMIAAFQDERCQFIICGKGGIIKIEDVVLEHALKAYLGLQLIAVVGFSLVTIPYLFSPLTDGKGRSK